MKRLLLLLSLFFFALFNYSQNVDLIVLGTAQDAGSPQIDCKKDCCTQLSEEEKQNRMVVSLGLIDRDENKTFLFEATPDIIEQTNTLSEVSGQNQTLINGIFLTHAHIGHYTGLMYLGRESTNSQNIEVYAMPRMQSFLAKNQPWKQLIDLNNIKLMNLKADSIIRPTNNIKITPIIVPHRDELSETVGYHIEGPSKSALFIPDIDKWEKWNRKLIAEIEKVDYAFLDATFYNGEEIKARDISEIPHPFVIESIKLLENIDIEEKSKIYFIHFNHTNRLLDPKSEESKKVESNGFHIAREGMSFEL